MKNKYFQSLQSSSNYKKWSATWLICAPLFFAVLLASCSKSPSGVRTIKQTSANVVNSNSNNQSVQAAVVQNLFFDLTSVSRPDQNVKVILEVKTPNGLFLPVTTDHSGSREAYGVYDDSSTGAKLEFRARCSDDVCSKYTLLMTVVKGGYAHHQVAVVSYRNDCKFNVENLNAAVTQAFYTSLDSVETKFAAAGVDERFDCPL